MEGHKVGDKVMLALGSARSGFGETGTVTKVWREEFKWGRAKYRWYCDVKWDNPTFSYPTIGGLTCDCFWNVADKKARIGRGVVALVS